MFNLELDYASLGRQLDDLGLQRTAVTIRTADDNPISPEALVRQDEAGHVVERQNDGDPHIEPDDPGSLFDKGQDHKQADRHQVETQKPDPEDARNVYNLPELTPASLTPMQSQSRLYRAWKR